MKILYGVQGTGNGHTARARAMSHALQQYHHVDVDFIFSGREKDKYFSMESFGNYQTRRGLTFMTEKGRVNYLKTAKENRFGQLISDIRQLDLSAYDLVISDFEPITSWAAKLQHKPCISLSHQNAFRYPVPLKGANWLDKKIITNFAPADHYLGLHWYHFEHPILPPIIHIGEAAAENQPFILIYLPFESLESIMDLFFRFGHYQFVCYHPMIDEITQTENMTFHPLCHEHFQEHLRCCAGVIANGGFELPSEAMSYGKKLLLKPLMGQFEQQSNVATLEILGLASAMESLDVAVIRQWLEEPNAERVVYPDVAQAIAEWVVQGRWDDHQPLCHSLWKQVNFPDYVTV
ncbi:MJ1255/VC2487 family glycosyltransferase [Vibrio rhizosphaerae]|uniref:Glycosyltransferase family protein n=1 Tax=Vibrio rhizosphaerae TaxID=398736 RepID=A0ABU4IRC2_9VIBR|nr:MJ1255/VC2487 family glycosyltransferase [Vibrio rhizosphaerae]MDW6091814.1 glycosyltransferase family protein [Vibrio rhizosphaerae]